MPALLRLSTMLARWSGGGTLSEAGQPDHPARDNTLWRSGGPESILTALGRTHGVTAVAMALPAGTFPFCAPPSQPGSGQSDCIV